MAEHYCVDHKQAWFKKGNMRGYAHPIKEGGKTIGWCAEPSEEKPPEPKITPKEQKPEIAPQERGMWYKEVGENFRAGLFKKDDNAAGSYIWQAYIKQMLSSLEITIPKSPG